MSWARKSKTVAVARPVTGHSGPQERPNPVLGRAPETRFLTFGPAALFGAVARCSLRRSIPPELAALERRAAEARIAHHVDDTSSEFFLLDGVRAYKDSDRSHFGGAVAAGLAYLFMIAEGHVWADHFENQTPKGDPKTRPGPDFVFASLGTREVALVESKGTTSLGAAAFDRTVAKGYTRQVEPHLGHRVGSGIASHGFAVGSRMIPGSSAPPAEAEMVVHHTRPKRSFFGGTSDMPPPQIVTAGSVVVGNYATVLDLVFGPGQGEPLRRGEPVDLPYDVVEWRGERWIVPRAESDTDASMRAENMADVERWRFALHEATALEVFARAGGAGSGDWDGFRPDGAVTRLADGRDSIRSGVFPDGLAVLAREEIHPHGRGGGPHDPAPEPPRLREMGAAEG
ncbi:hypothetical protein [Pinisolibacter aquiterrae]|uniref:hypothetical protein n=1 Tax=Pinisolibacter aquiterrae TaxID=2815579 RepID=UPI001C3D4839|nr:hypothetical protein [Pinisolibacter aquiterrae]MBV5264845.1 hypothetical protein [Pinisolibacter aquiterrae]MCC8234264.1 hypothetical protein [Pinisolibacter aquiterrae]